MKYGFMALVAVLFSAQAGAASLDEIDSYGVYIEGEEGYVKLRPYEHNHFELTRLDSIPHVERRDERVRLVVYQEDFDPDLMALRAQYIALVGGYDELQTDVAPTERDDVYRVEVVSDVPEDRVLFLTSGWYGYRGLAVSLSDPEVALEKLLSDMSQPAHAALPTVEELIDVYPDNAAFAELLPRWQQQEQNARAERDYNYVQEAWENYQSEPKLAVQLRHLQRLRSELNGYLNNHPEGEQAEQASERLQYANDRIEELERQL